MRTANHHEVTDTRRMWAVVSPLNKHGRRWIDYTSVRPTAKAAKAAATGSWKGGWADLHKRGWTVARVVIIAVEA